MIQGAPPDVQNSPQGYYYWLISNGFPHNVAYSEMTKVFGAPKSKEQLAKEAAKQEQKSQLAGVAGTVGGAAATGWALEGFPIPSWMKSGPPTQTPPPVTPTASQAPSIPTSTPSASSVGGMSQMPSVPGATVGNTIPAGQTVPSGYTAVGSAADGGTIIAPSNYVNSIPKEAMADQGFLNSVNWGQVAQGGLALAQLYGAYKSFKAGDKVGGALGAATGAGNLALATGAASSTGTLGASVIPGLNIATGAYGAYKTAEQTGSMAAGKQRDIAGAIGGATSGLALGLGGGALAGATMGSWAGPIGMAIGALAGYAGSKFFGSHKGKAQVMRDSIRGVLQQGGILDKDFKGTLANGSTYDFGKDGSTLKWKEIDKISAAQPKAWNGAVPLADALAASYGFVGQKASDIAAWYAKGAVSNAGDDANIARQNMQHFAKQQGITYDQIKTKLDEAIRDNRISQSQYDYYMGGARQLIGGAGAPGAPGGVQTRIERPKAGEVARVSPGLYRNDKGKLTSAPTMREALEKNYGKKKEK